LFCPLPDRQEQRTLQNIDKTNKNEIRFTSLDPAIYYARILVDDNGNKYWDKANFSEQKFAEEAFVFEKKLEVRKLWEIVENWVLE